MSFSHILDFPKCHYTISELLKNDKDNNITEYSYKNITICPLIEISEPHGDLIDKDYFLDILDKIIQKPDSFGQQQMAMATAESLIHLPVVIEAEK